MPVMSCLPDRISSLRPLYTPEGLLKEGKGISQAAIERAAGRRNLLKGLMRTRAKSGWLPLCWLCPSATPGRVPYIPLKPKYGLNGIYGTRPGVVTQASRLLLEAKEAL